MSLVVLYIATIAAGLLYRTVANFFQVLGGNSIVGQTLCFWLVLGGVSITLEALLRSGFADVDLPKLRFLDNLLGLIPGIVSGVIIVTLLFTSIGFITSERWSALDGLRAGLSNGYRNAFLGPFLSQFLRIYMGTHFLWFRRPPPLLGYALPLPE
jgi:hypothetical protein